MAKTKRLAGYFALLLQYGSALVVLFVAMHLHLAAQLPMAAIRKSYVAYMPLEFDNVFRNFSIFLFNLEGTSEWKVKLRRSLVLGEKYRAHRHAVYASCCH